MPNSTTSAHPCGRMNGDTDKVVRSCLKGYWARPTWHGLPCRGDNRLCDCPFPNRYQAKEGKPPQSRQFPLF